MHQLHPLVDNVVRQRQFETSGSSFSPVEVVDVVERRRMSEAHASLPDVLTAVDGLKVLSGVLEKHNKEFTAMTHKCRAAASQCHVWRCESPPEGHGARRHFAAGARGDQNRHLKSNSNCLFSKHHDSPTSHNANLVCKSTFELAAADRLLLMWINALQRWTFLPSLWQFTVNGRIIIKRRLSETHPHITSESACTSCLLCTSTTGPAESECDAAPLRSSENKRARRLVAVRCWW